MSSSHFSKINQKIETKRTPTGYIFQILSDKHRAVVEFNFDTTSWPNRKKNIAGNETMLSFKMNPSVRQAEFATNVSDLIHDKIFPAILDMPDIADIIGLYPAAGQEAHSDFVFAALKDVGVAGRHICVARVPVYSGKPKPVDGTVITLSNRLLAERMDGFGTVRVYDDVMSDWQLERQFGPAARRVTAPKLG